MKTSIINNLAAIKRCLWHLTASGLLAITAPLTVTAQSLTVSNSAYPSEAGMTYSSTTIYVAALTVSGSLGSYSGTNITLSASNAAYAHGASVNRGELLLFSSTINTSGPRSYGVISQNDGARVYIADSHIETTEDYGRGLYASVGSGTWTVIDTTVITRGNHQSEALVVSDRELFSGTNLTLTTTGHRVQSTHAPAGILTYMSGTVMLWNSRINTSGTGADGVLTEGPADTGGRIELHQVDIHVTGESAAGVRLLTTEVNSGTRSLLVDGGSINAARDSGIAVAVQPVSPNGYLPGDAMVGADVVYDLTITGGATVSGTSAIEVASIYTGTNAAGDLVPLDKNVTADIRVDSSSTLNGSVNIRDTAVTTLNMNNSTLVGNLSSSGSATLTVALDNSSEFTGLSTLSGSGITNLSLTNGAVWNLTGTSSVTTLSNSGTVIIANALGEDLSVSGTFVQDANGTLDLNLSGSGPIVNAGTASLGGTLKVSGFSGTVAAKASEIVSKNFTVIHSASGISGDFSTVDLGGAASTVDYVTLAVGLTNSDRDYALNYSLSWFAASSTSHGNFTINSGTTFEIDIVLSDTAVGQGAGGWDGKSLTKLGDGLLLVSSSNNFTGGANIESGTLRLSNLNGLGTGTVNVAQTILSVLDLSASGTYKNDTTGAGPIILSGSGVNISGNNSTFAGTWDVTGSGTMTSQNNLGVSGSTAVNIASGGALSLILGDGDYHFDQPLTGSGFLLIQNAGNITLVPSVPLVAYVPSFTGTVALERNTLALTADNALPLSLATLVTGTNNLVVVDSDPSATARNLGALSFSGGTIRFEGYDPHATRADTIIALTGTLNLNGGGTVEVVMPNPSQIPDGSKFTHIPLLQQDDGLALTLLISASNGVTGSPAALALRDDSGRVISDAYTLNLSHDGVTTDAIGTYDYLLSTGSANDGLYVAFGLKQVDIQAGRTLTLDQDTTTPAEGDDFTATIIGSGNLQINATNAITLNGTGNRYSGTTIVSTGTLIVGADYNMFASSTAFVINSGAALNTGGFDQRVNNLSGSGLATFTGNTLTVNNTTNTNFTGTLSGGALVKDGSAQLNANDAKATLTQVQIENGEIILGQNATVSASNNPAVIANGGTATFNNSALSTSGSVLILAKDNAPATVNLNNMTVNVSGSGHLVEIDKGALTVNLNNTNATGDISAFNGSTGLVNLTNNSVLTGRIDPVGVSIDHSTWNMTGRSRITTLHGANGGTITIDNVEGEDLTVSNGITGQTALNLTLSDSVKGNQEIWVVVDETNNMTGERFTLSHEVSYGMYNYNLVNASDGAWLVYTGSSGTIPPVNPPPVNPPTISNEGDTIINTAAAVAGFWFTQLDNLHKRMGELRYNKPADGDLINNVWVRAYGQQINANTGIYSVKGFSETQYGVDLGTDYLWKLDAANQLYTGIFAGYGGADRDFHTSYSGNTDSGYGGLYATWLNKDGWYADVVAKGQYFRNSFDGEDHAEYDSLGAGISLEVGNMFEFKDGWFVEPSAQFSYLHLMNDNYTTRDNLHVNLTDADVLHIYGGARFGRNIKLTHSGMLQPYIKAGGLGQISSGNKLTVNGDHWRPNLDGARAVVGAGLIWQLDADSQLHLDYEASFGEKYDKPWGVNFGYRYQF